MQLEKIFKSYDLKLKKRMAPVENLSGRKINIIEYRGKIQRNTQLKRKETWKIMVYSFF